MSKVLSGLITRFQKEREKAEHQEIKEHYQGMIDMYSDFQEFYEKIKKEDETS